MVHVYGLLIYFKNGILPGKGEIVAAFKRKLLGNLLKNTQNVK
jgi:hypothetical protein